MLETCAILQLLHGPSESRGSWEGHTSDYDGDAVGARKGEVGG